MSIKVAQKGFCEQNKRFWQIYKNCQKSVSTMGKIIVAMGFEKLPKCNKSPNLVTLLTWDSTLEKITLNFFQKALLHWPPPWMTE